MAEKDAYLFIINPGSGTSISRNPAEVGKAIASFAERKGARAVIRFTERARHATEIVHEHSAQENWKAIVAVGGDGTVNEVAKGLVHGEIPLGILALGSGNGLARHLALPLKLEAALEHLFVAKPTTIDSAEVNGIPFFCTSGIGFDAYVGQIFSQQSTRGLSTYVSVSMRAFWNYKPQQYTLNGKELSVFSLCFANAGQFGNNAWVVPQANVQDGLLDVCIIRPFPLWYGSSLTYQLFSKTMKPSTYIAYDKVTTSVVEAQTPPLIHYDGEPLLLDTNRIEYVIRPASLKVMI